MTRTPRTSLAALLLLFVAACGSTAQVRTTAGGGPAGGTGGDQGLGLPGQNGTVPTAPGSPGGVLPSFPGGVNGGGSGTAGPVLPGGGPGGGPNPSLPAGGGGGSTTRAVGITNTEVKIGVIIAAGNPGTAFGSGFGYNTESTTAIVKAMVEEVNASGGIAGRKVIASYAYNDNTNGDSSNQTQQQNAICTRFTEDEKVFAVFAFNPAGVNYAYDCFAKHQTPIIDTLLADADTRQMAELKPWLIAPIYVNWGRMARVLPQALAESGFLTKKMGVFSYDRPTLRRTQKALVAEIERRGGKVLETVYADATYDSLASTSASAVLSFKRQGIDRVVMWAPQCGPLIVFAGQAKSQQYAPRYGLTTYNTPSFCATIVPAEQLAGAAGAGFLMANDVSGTGAPPPTAREKACFARIAKRTGGTYTQRGSSGDAGFALGVCEELGFLQFALRPATGLHVGNADVAGYVARVGTSYPSINVPRTRFGADKLDGADQYSALDFHADCKCFHYKGGWRDIG